MNKTKILFYDIENSPSLGWVWGKYEQNVLSFEQQNYMLSYSYKWGHEKTIKVVALPDFKTYKKSPTDDKELVKSLWDLFNEADIVVAHNGDSFDQKMSNARFLFHGMKPPEPYKSIDTKKVAKKYFRFNSNSLNDLSTLLGIGVKAETGGIDLWFQCMAGNLKAWNTMKKYNKQDVHLLVQVYEKMKGWMTNHPNVNLVDEKEIACPNCGSEHLQRRGFGYTKVGKYQRYQCQNEGCGCWSHGKVTRTKVELTT